MALALPGSNGCFSFLQQALTESDLNILITENMHQHLQDLLIIAKEITSRTRPTHLNEIVPKIPSYFGAVDAAKGGMGGVWLPPLVTWCAIQSNQPKLPPYNLQFCGFQHFPKKIKIPLFRLPIPTEQHIIVIWNWPVQLHTTTS